MPIRETVTLIVPTLNASAHVPEFLEALARQTRQPDELLVIDSSSVDDTITRFRAGGAKVLVVPRHEFDHGGTRNVAVHAASGSVLVLMTQDVVLAHPNALEKLVGALEDDAEVAVAYGRQLPHPSATHYAAHTRAYNYPATSERRTAEDLAHRGTRAAFCSNAFSAYRRRALERVDGFPERAIVSEDMIAGIRLLNAGYAIRYVSDAPVYHSHDFSAIAEFRLLFDIGVAHTEHADELMGLVGLSRGGSEFVISEYAYLRRHGTSWLTAAPQVLLRNAARWCGYQSGRRFRWLPRRLVSVISMQKQYWRREQDGLRPRQSPGTKPG